MSMFTRCAHCESTFRVTLAQLQASGGQVRCGVCLEVFDAFVTLSARDPRAPIPEDPVPSSAAGDDADAALLMLEALPQASANEVGDGNADAVPPWSSIAVDPFDDFAAAPVADGDSSAARTDPNVPRDAHPVVVVDEAVPDAMTDPAPGTFDESEMSPLPALDEPDVVGTDVVGTDVDETDDPAVAEPVVAAPALAESAPLAAADDSMSRAWPVESPVSLASDTTLPVDGRDDETWPVAESPVMPHEGASLAPDEPEAERKVSGPVPPIIGPSGFVPPRPSRASPGLVTGAALLALLLIGQAVYLLRAAIAEAAPSTRPSLDTACRFLRCSIALPRLTDRLTIEASDLQALDPLHPNRVTLTATIRNRARLEQAFPLLELTLTDAREDVAARKVFGPTEYLSAAPTGAGIAANAELGVRLPLDTGDIVATGYRLYLFHP